MPAQVDRDDAVPRQRLAGEAVVALPVPGDAVDREDRRPVVGPAGVCVELGHRPGWWQTGAPRHRPILCAVADAPPERRERYAHFRRIPTRWLDVDVYGHVNNVVYYAYFDTVINGYLVDAGVLDPHGGAIVGFARETMCRFHRPIAFPQAIDAGLRVGHVGRTSVRYEIGLFIEGEDEPAADGHFVHVFVDRAARRPAPLPDDLRAALQRLVVEA